MSYWYNDMKYNSKQEADNKCGTIKLCYSGQDLFGSTQNGEYIKYREYILLSTDINKLDNITNATDGSKAIVADTGDVYLLCDEMWQLQPKISSIIGESELRWSH